MAIPVLDWSKIDPKNPPDEVPAEGGKWVRDKSIGLAYVFVEEKKEPEKKEKKEKK